MDEQIAHKPFNKHFNSWLVTRMYAAGLKDLNGWLQRFEWVASVLPEDGSYANIDFQKLENQSGISASRLKSAAVRLVEDFGVLRRMSDHCSTLYAFNIDPYNVNTAGRAELTDQIETSTERLYRSCCDIVNRRILDIVIELQELRHMMGSDLGMAIVDHIVALTELSTMLTRVSAAGVSKDRNDYLRKLTGEMKCKLK